MKQLKSDKLKTGGTAGLNTGWSDVHQRMEEIRSLEKRIVALKRDLLRVRENEALGRADQEVKFLLMRIGQMMIALPVYSIEEVVQMPAVIPLTEKRESVLGLVDFHGTMVAVVDLGALLGMGSSHVTIDKSLVVFHLPPHKFAIMIDEAVDVITVPGRAIQISDEVLPGTLRAAGVLRLKTGKSILVFDVGMLALSIELLGVLDVKNENDNE